MRFMLYAVFLSLFFGALSGNAFSQDMGFYPQSGGPPGMTVYPDMGPPGDYPSDPYSSCESPPNFCPQGGYPMDSYPSGAYPSEGYSMGGYPSDAYPLGDYPVLNGQPLLDSSPQGYPVQMDSFPQGSGYDQMPPCLPQGSPIPTTGPNGSKAMQTQTTVPLSPGQNQTLYENQFTKQRHLRPNCPPEAGEGYTINFENIGIIELIHFLSRISGTNFIFDTNDLQFQITIVSQDETTVEDLSSALLQVLKIHGLSVAEQGNNVLIYRDQNLSRVSTIITDENINDACDSAIITRVFRLLYVDPTPIMGIVKPLLSPDSIVEVSQQTRHLIVTDIRANVDKIADLLNALDTQSPEVYLDYAEYTVQSAFPAALAAYAREILQPLAEGSPFQIIAQPSAHKIFIVSTPFLIAKAKQVLASLDTPEVTDVTDLPPSALPNNGFFMYKLKYQDGRLIADALHEIGTNLQYAGVVNPEFLNAIYSSQWIEVNNSIVVTGTTEAVEKVVELLDELDMQPKQVFVEVLVIDTTLENSLDFGVQWIALGDEQNKLAFASGLLNNVPPSPNLQGGISSPTSSGAGSNPGARFVAANPASGPPAIPNPGRDVALPQPSQLGGLTNFNNNLLSAFGLGFIGNIIRHNGESFLTLGALVSALDAEAQTSILLNPRIMVEDNQPADFFVGTNIPYQTTSTVIQQTGSVTQNIQYEDIGVGLRVIPTISPDNIVTLQIDQSIVELQQLITNNLIAPQTNKTLTTTRVHVPDGTFLVMSGHIRDQSTCIRSGIPCLGTLPLIGPLFSRTVDARAKRNLILFIRPKVVDSIASGLKLTNQEGYDYNWESHPCSVYECGIDRAPECETWPPPVCPDH